MSKKPLFYLAFKQAYETGITQLIVICRVELKCAKLLMTWNLIHTGDPFHAEMINDNKRTFVVINTTLLTYVHLIQKDFICVLNFYSVKIILFNSLNIMSVKTIAKR